MCMQKKSMGESSHPFFYKQWSFSSWCKVKEGTFRGERKMLLSCAKRKAAAAAAAVERGRGGAVTKERRNTKAGSSKLEL